MTRRPPATETRISLRMIPSAGVLVLLVLACAGGDYTTIPAAVDAASTGDTIEVRMWRRCRR